MTSRIAWRRLDAPGEEHAELAAVSDGWRLSGNVRVTHDGVPCRLEYVIHCDTSWRTLHAHIDAHVGATVAQLELARSAHEEWLVNGVAVPALHGCADVDLGFSPSTNLFPIRRLDLAIGACADVRAAWVRFPELTVEVLDQTYTRIGATRYLYESASGTFRRELTVNAEGFVLDYPGLWRAEETSSSGALDIERS